MKLDFQNSTWIRVRYGETDQMGYCYYGNYAQYFEVGRVEALRGLGMSYRAMEAAGIMLPVLDYQVKYIRPAYYDDELEIVTKIVKLEGSRIYFEYEIRNKTGESISIASTTLVFVSKKSMKPTRVPSDFNLLISNYAKQE